MAFLKLGDGASRPNLALPLLLQCLFCLLLVVSARPEGGPHRAAAAAQAFSSQCDAQGPRQECGWNGIPVSECLSKGCCFSQAPARQGELALRLPSCFRPNGGDSSYSVTSISPISKRGSSSNAAAAASQMTGEAKGTLSQAASAAASLGPDLGTLDFSLTLPARDVARLTIGADRRWRVPASVVPGVSGVEQRERGLGARGGDRDGNGNGNRNGEQQSGGSELEVQVVSSPSFAAVVGRKNGNGSSSASSSPLLDTRGFRLVFKDRYIELTTRLPEGGKGALYGLGERTSSSERLPLRRNSEGVPFTLWTRDAAVADADQNSYGSWPVAWFVAEEDGATTALAMLNSNAIDVVATDQTLTWRLTGGEVDLFVLSGPTPALVAQQLASVIGLPTLQPPWAFGAMNSKYGYASAAQCRAVLDSFDGAGVPLEAWVSDSQYMSGDRIFTWSDDFTKAEMRDFVKHLRSTGDRRWVPILDPVVRVQKGYAPFDEASADGGIFLKGVDGKPYMGQMWPGAVHWPDFLDNPSTQRWWTRWLRQVKEDVTAIDGVWLDMNEVSNFCSGDICRPPLSSKTDTSRRIKPEEVPPNANFVCLLDCEFGPFDGKKKENSSDDGVPASVFAPPYSVNSAGGQRNLSEKTLPVSARHPGTGALEYDAHNLYGHSMARATHEALSQVNKVRPFLFSRSSFLGTGALSGHWTGDTSSSWRDLRRLTPSVLLSGLALIPFVGGDVGGFMNGASSELADRWIAAASLHPFFRFHHAQGFQEPFRRFAGSSGSGGGGNETRGSEWGPVRDAARSSLGLRYRLLPTLYSAAAQAAATGCPTARPLWFLWPASRAARERAGAFAVGDSLVVAPALEPGVESVEVSLPPGVSFFDFYSRRRVGGSASSPAPSSAAAAVVVSLPAPRGKPPPILVVAGGVVAVAGEEGQVFPTTSAARAAPLTLIAALPPAAAERREGEEGGAAGAAAGATTLRCGRSCEGEGSACGDLYLDRGDELDPGNHKRGRILSVDASRNSVRLSWPAPAGGSSPSSRCEPGLPWPRLSRIVVLGDDLVASSSSSAVKVTRVASPGGAKLKVDASLDARTGESLELAIGGGGLQLKCGEEFEVEWK